MQAHLDRFMLILIDGAPYQVFAELLEDGMLPEIKRHIVDRGCLQKAVSVFPSTTGPAYIPFLMGLYPGTANIPGIRWLSKQHFQSPHRFRSPGICSYMGIDGVAFSADLPDKPTLFDFFSPVSNIYNLLTRGCPPSRDHTRRLKLLTYGYAHLSDHWSVVDAIAARRLLRAVDEGAQFVMCLFPGVDAYAHLSHTKSDAVLRAYRRIDRAVGQLCQRLQRSGDYDNTLILLTSDHGMSNTYTHVDVPRHLTKSGWRCLHYPLLWQHNVECACLVSGNGMSNVYFKSNKHRWGERIPFEQLRAMGVVDALLDLEGIDFVAGQDSNGSIVVSKETGTGRVSGISKKISYNFTGRDPLGYKRYCKDLSHSEALTWTYDSDYPDGLVQLWQLFQSSRTGDLVISARPGYDLRARYEFPEHHATHGAMIAEQMHVPLAMSRPIEAEFVRTVDVFPTVLSQFGLIAESGAVDGQILR